MKNIKLYDFRIKAASVFNDYSFLVFLLHRFSCFSLSGDCVDAYKGGRAADSREGQFLISGNNDGISQRSGDKRRDSVFPNPVAKNTIIAIAIFIAFIISIVFSFFSVLYVMG